MLKQPFYLAASILLFCGWIAVLLGYNMPITWWINHKYHLLADDFFIHFSWLAEWALILTASLIALISNWKRGVLMGLSLGLQALTVAAIKWSLNAPRPIEINPTLVRIIPNLDIHHWQAFPSGHTAVAFYTMGWLALQVRSSSRFGKISESSLFVVAAGIGYSRMYLGQHSLIDVCAGGTLALLFLMLAEYLTNKWLTHE